MSNGSTVSKQSAVRQTALRFVLLIGILSFFADFTYEGSRSILGPYLASLQASAFAVGVITGFGELLGYSLRLVSGRLADRTQKFWPIAIPGGKLATRSCADHPRTGRQSHAQSTPRRDAVPRGQADRVRMGVWHARGTGSIRCFIWTFGRRVGFGHARRLSSCVRGVGSTCGYQLQPTFVGLSDISTS